MKNCPICKKEIDLGEDVCCSCDNFYKWKHGKNCEKRKKRIINFLKKTSSLERTKLNGRYKNE